MDFEQWKGFEKGEWKRQINVRDFIQKNYTPYEGNSSFLTGTTEKTQKLWNEVLELYKKEHSSQGGVLDIDTDTISTITSHEAGYIDKDLEEIVGLQTDEPLKRAIMPFGGIKIVEKSCQGYGREVNPEVDKIFNTVRKTHNDGVFSVYTPDIRAARSSHLITGLPDGYGRGRIIGDYRRVALYGVDVLIAGKKEELDELNVDNFTEEIIRQREELFDQIAALEARKINAADPTAIWRWKEDRDNARRIANEQNKTSNSAKANALIEVSNAVDNMIVDDRLDTPTANAMLSKLADYKTLLQKNGLPTNIVDEKIKKIKGEDNPGKNKGPENSEYSGRPKEQWDKEAKELLAKDNLTQGDIIGFKQKNPILSDDVMLELNIKHNALIEKDKQIALNKRYEAARKKAGIDSSMWKLMSKAKRKEVLDKSGL